MKVSSLLGQDWALMAYTVNQNDTAIFSGVFKSTSQEDIVLGSDCVGQRCVYKMTPKEFIKSMEFLGWELSEYIQFKDKRRESEVWFRRYY